MRAISVIGVTLVMLAASAQASEKEPSSWQFRAQFYVWLPSFDAETAFPPSDGGVDATVDTSDFETSLNVAFMGSLETRKERWGILSDLVYLDIQEDASAADQFVLSDSGGKIQVPVDAGASATLRIRGWAAALAGAYTGVDTSRQRLKILAGLRYLKLDTTFTWDLDVTAGSLPAQAVSGNTTVEPSYLDAVVGVSGRAKLGQGRWFAQYHLDMGTGESDFTWQAVAGIGHAFEWGEILVLYRILDYDLPSGSAVRSVALRGPAVSVAYAW